MGLQDALIRLRNDCRAKGGGRSEAARRCWPDSALQSCGQRALNPCWSARFDSEAAVVLDTFDEEYVVMNLMIIVTAIGEDGPLGGPVAERVAVADLFEGDPARFGLILRSMALMALNHGADGA